MSIRRWSINGTQITDDGQPYVIAELSHNHNGSFDIAYEMILAAASCGANAVKLQKRSPVFYDALRGKGLTEYADLRQGRELDLQEYKRLGMLAHKVALDFIATAFDEWALDFLLQAGVDAIKIASGTTRNLPLITAAAKTKLPLIISTGCSDLGHVGCAWATANIYHDNVCLLQCTSEYPCQPEHLDLGVLDVYAKQYLAMTGLSSHTITNTFEPIAFALGARLFEKHFTLSRAMGEGDHRMSLEPDGLRDLVDVLKSTRDAIGTGRKQFLPCEEIGRSRLDLAYRLTPAAV